MQLRLIIVLAFLIPNIILFSQEYPIPADGAEWNSTVVDLQTIMHNQSTTRFEIIGDTLIETQLYAKLIATWEVGYYQTGDCDFSSSGTGGININKYLGAIRTDDNYRVRYIHFGETEALTLYDFSLLVGDSVLISEISNPYYAYVLDIDTISLGESNRKKLTMRGMYGIEDIWIEGIGSLYGLLSTEFRYGEFYEYELTCYKENGSILYTSDPICTRCDIVTSIKSSYCPNHISIYPNPVVEKSMIEWPHSIYPIRLNVYDLLGKVVYSKSIVGSDNCSINQLDLREGIVIIELIDENYYRYRQKVIVL